jgi:hypothetical protein
MRVVNFYLDKFQHALYYVFRVRKQEDAMRLVKSEIEGKNNRECPIFLSDDEQQILDFIVSEGLDAELMSVINDYLGASLYEIIWDGLGDMKFDELRDVKRAMQIDLSHVKGKNSLCLQIIHEGMAYDYLFALEDAFKVSPDTELKSVIAAGFDLLLQRILKRRSKNFPLIIEIKKLLKILERIIFATNNRAVRFIMASCSLSKCA